MFKYHKDFDKTPDDVLYLSCIFAYSQLSVAWLVYEYCITLNKETEFFWGRRPNGGSFLFFLSRYLPLLVRSLGISGYVVMSEQRCIVFLCFTGRIAFHVADSLQYLPCAAFAGVRAWVLGGRSWSLTAFVAVLSLVPVGLAYVSTENLSHTNNSTNPLLS
ncbi:hypothetical protein V8D89_005603 [Ganoderma adspersum]